ncbi:unnamed protein product [Pieris brassicae]|uniref:Uncharacterized protein n=1 Tax=Pieris brassicae TaxID=7116 RepID=A0A9P0TL20_PIEBR|nr:unnamed protein product [Pieris brassicae]
MSICTCVKTNIVTSSPTNYGNGATRSACHPRPLRPALLTNSHVMYVISPLARTHHSNAQLDQRPSGIAKKITSPRLQRGIKCNIIVSYFTSLVRHRNNLSEICGTLMSILLAYVILRKLQQLLPTCC